MDFIYEAVVEMFGLANMADATFGELIPMLLMVVITFCLFLKIFDMFKYFAAALVRGGRL